MKQNTATQRLLHTGLIKLGIPETQTALYTEKLQAYVEELELFNSVYDLTAAKTKEDIEIRHVMDSLAALSELFRLQKQIAQSRRIRKQSGQFVIADIGSGAGLPGIPLAILMPDTNFVLVERMSKRCLFLENCVAVLGLKNISVQNIEAERIEHKSFDIAVFRALHPLNKKILRILLRTLKDGGFLAAYKAKKDKINEEVFSARISSFEIVPLHVPFLENHERHLLIIPANSTKA